MGGPASVHCSLPGRLEVAARQLRGHAPQHGLVGAAEGRHAVGSLVTHKRGHRRHCGRRRAEWMRAAQVGGTQAHRRGSPRGSTRWQRAVAVAAAAAAAAAAAGRRAAHPSSPPPTSSAPAARWVRPGGQPSAGRWQPCSGACWCCSSYERCMLVLQQLRAVHAGAAAATSLARLQPGLLAPAQRGCPSSRARLLPTTGSPPCRCRSCKT